MPNPDGSTSIEDVLGTWEVEGDPFEVVRTPQGGIAASRADGVEISPAWVLLNGRRVVPISGVAQVSHNLPFTLPSSLALLERTPATLRALLDGLPEEWITATEGPDTWSPYDVVGHLAVLEETDWLVRINRIVDPAEDPRFDPVDRFAMFTASQGKSLATLLDEFADRRARNLARVREMNLSAEDFLKEGIHPTFGTVTLRQLLATWAAHDLSHIAQIVRVMAKRYRDEVGPWRANLSVMDR